ncbi:MAG: hypothetical protein ACE5HV_15785 [Acidobacteriota bacterium]
MKTSSWSRCWRAGALLLSLWVTLFVIVVGTHVPPVYTGGGQPGSFTGEQGEFHAPWHRHAIGKVEVSWSPGQDACAVCLAQNGSRALHSKTPLLHPAGTGQRLLAQAPTSRLLRQPAAQPPSRAPPQL